MSTDMILAYNCDYGDIAMLTTNELISLPEQFLKLPQLAIKAKLYGKQLARSSSCSLALSI